MDWWHTLREAGYSGDINIRALIEDCNRLWGPHPKGALACLLMLGPNDRLCGGYLEDGVFKPCGEADSEQEALTLLWCELKWKYDLKVAGYQGKTGLAHLIGACPVAMRAREGQPLSCFVLKRCEPLSPHWVAGYPDFLWGPKSILAEGAVSGLWRALGAYRRDRAAEKEKPPTR